MIVISTYNPDTKRTTQDEELLSTLLASLVRHVVRCEAGIVKSDNDIDREFYTSQKTNCNRLIGLTYPLLGLDWSEVGEVISGEREKWLIDHTGKK